MLKAGKEGGFSSRNLPFIKNLKTFLGSLRKEKHRSCFFPEKEGQTIIPVSTPLEELFSNQNPELPSTEVTDYLMDAIAFIPPTEKLSVCFTEEREKERILRNYRAYLSMRIKKCETEVRLASLRALWLLLAGLVVLTVYFILAFTNHKVLGETISIIGGFLIWEASEVFLFQRNEHRVELLNYCRLYLAEWK